MDWVVEITDRVKVAARVLTRVFTNWTSVLTVVVRVPMALSRSYIDTLAELTGAEILTGAAATAGAELKAEGSDFDHSPTRLRAHSCTRERQASAPMLMLASTL